MTDDEPMPAEVMLSRDDHEPDSVVLRPGLVVAVSRAARSAPALALAAIIVATATLISMSAANDIAEARVESSHHFNNLDVIRWTAGTRLVMAGIALLLALLAGAQFARELPGTRYTFSDSDDDAVETPEGAEPPTSLKLLVGSAFLVAVLAVVLNAVALIFALSLHESLNFGVPTG
jgi:hypothetical protein